MPDCKKQKLGSGNLKPERAASRSSLRMLAINGSKGKSGSEVYPIPPTPDSLVWDRGCAIDDYAVGLTATHCDVP
jgi:hypothetical protein